MKRIDRVQDEKGLALPVALIALLALSGLLLAFLTLASTEPQISANLAAVDRARYVAEAGIEVVYDSLATNVIANPSYLTTLLANASPALSNQQPWVVVANASPLPGLAADQGTYTVSVRNDFQGTDGQITGVAVDGGGVAADTNNLVVIRSVGTVGNATRTISVAFRANLIPTINAALAFPGVQADVNFNGSAFTIRGIDTNMNDSNGSAPPVYGISVSTTLPASNPGGNEAVVENSLQNNQLGNEVTGKDETNPQATTNGLNAIQADAALTSQMVIDFVNALKATADIKYESSPGNGNNVQIQSFGSSCEGNINSQTCWGTDAHPKIVYVHGNLTDINTQFTALDISGTSTGTGILIVENGNVEINGNFRWNGPIIISGNNVSLKYRGGGEQAVYGAVIVNEMHADGSANVEGDIRGNAKIFYSTEALSLVQSSLSRRLVTKYSWREQ